MGITFDMVCHDCELQWDIGKHYQATRLLYPIAKQHEGHRMQIINDCGDMCTPSYKEEKLWDHGTLLDNIEFEEYPHGEMGSDVLNGWIFTYLDGKLVWEDRTDNTEECK